MADDKPTDGFDALLTEDRTFDPPEAFAKNANMNDPDIYAKADADPEAFWAGIAGELEWSRPWDTILDWRPPDAKWFIGGKINASVNCVDRHALGSRRDKRAIVWEGEPGDQKTLTYGELHAEVQKCANVLKRLGVGHGDRVAVYLPMIPELPIVMLACARIGAVHSVVFGGFSAESLRDRINDMQAKLLVTADGGFRRGGVVPLKEISDAALDGAPSVKNVLLVKREGLETPFKVVKGRDHWYLELMSWVGETCPPRENDAEDLLFT
ncbi:MAG: AMP-binding protein, partial [Acidobacteriota bacterium]|nr:AMP-binding protein [Acidobacteriota bacterium]